MCPSVRIARRWGLAIAACGTLAGGYCLVSRTASQEPGGNTLAAAAALRHAPGHVPDGTVLRAPGDAGPDRTEWLIAALRDAADGATIQVPAGLYRGPLTVDRPVHLHADPGAHLRGDGRTHTVAIRAAGVTLDGFEISGSGLDLSQDHA